MSVVESGRVYRIAGGAPLYVSTWDAFGGPQPTRSVSQSQLDALRPYPVDMFLVGSRSGRVFRVPGPGRTASKYISPLELAPGGVQPTMAVDDWALDNCDHLVCEPFGSVDSVSPVAGGVRASGWAMDPNTTSPSAVHVYSDGAYVTALTAALARPGRRRHLPPRSGLRVRQLDSAPRSVARGVPVCHQPGSRCIQPAAGLPQLHGNGTRVDHVVVRCVRPHHHLRRFLDSVRNLSRSDSGAAMAGQAVRVETRATPAGTWKLLRIVTTTSTGAVSLSVKPTAGASYRLRFTGSFSYAPVMSTARDVVVKTKVSLAASSYDVARGSVVTFSGAVTDPYGVPRCRSSDTPPRDGSPTPRSPSLPAAPSRRT